MTAHNPTTPPIYKTIRGFSRYRFGDDGSAWTCRNSRGNPCEWRPLRGSITRKGYVRLILVADDGRYVGKLLHNLILEAFVGPRPTGMECCHADDAKLNNRLENLRWDTSKANAADLARNGRKPDRRGEKNGRARLDAATVVAIRAQISAGVKRRYVRAEFGLTINQFTKIKAGKTWSHVF